MFLLSMRRAGIPALYVGVTQLARGSAAQHPAPGVSMVRVHPNLPLPSDHSGRAAMATRPFMRLLWAITLSRTATMVKAAMSTSLIVRPLCTARYRKEETICRKKSSCPKVQQSRSWSHGMTISTRSSSPARKSLLPPRRSPPLLQRRNKPLCIVRSGFYYALNADWR